MKFKIYLLIAILLNLNQMVKTEKKCEEFLNRASYTFCFKCNIYCQNPLNVVHEQLKSCSDTNVKVKTLDKFTSLISLSFSELSYQSIDKNAFEKLNKLENLIFDLNKLTQLENGTFNGLISLKCLLLENNYIETIMPDTFLMLNKLERLYLGLNRLKMLI